MQLTKLSLLLLVILFSTSSIAEVITDGTLQPKVDIESLNSNYRIDAKFGKQYGSNLFHSFQEFNIETGRTATFSGPTTIIDNVISRVTGGNPSSIDGKLISTIPEADMYFINPAGIVFGKNAKLHVDGSFHISTADYILFTDNKRYSVSNPNTSILTVASPYAFGFLTRSSSEIYRKIGTIEINSISKEDSFLKVPDGENISIIGGDITMKDNHPTNAENTTLKAPDGVISLVSVASSGEIPIDFTKDDNVRQFGTISIKDTSVEGRKPNIDTSGKSGGNIYIKGGNIYVENAKIWADTAGAKNGQGITIKATNDLSISGDTRITAVVTETGSGNGGDIEVSAKKIILSTGGEISTATRSTGNGGNINISAEDSVKISDYEAGIAGISSNTTDFTEGKPGGNGGQISINTPNLILENDATIHTTTLTNGNAGDIILDTNNIMLRNGGQINLNSGNKYRGFNFNNKITGNAGKLTISSESIFINGKTSRRSALNSNTFTKGTGGKIGIVTSRLEMQDGGTIQAATVGSGKGGEISIAADELNLIQGATITAESLGENHAGDAGNININILDGGILNMNNAAIITKSVNASGGNITIENPKLFILNKSQILAGAKKDGGEIDIIPSGYHFIPSYPYKEGGDIEFKNIPYNDKDISIINASSELGMDGEINIDSPDQDVLSFIPITAKDFLIEKTFASRCLSRGKNLRFLMTTRTVSPPTPYDLRK